MPPAFYMSVKSTVCDLLIIWKVIIFVDINARPRKMDLPPTSPKMRRFSCQSNRIIKIVDTESEINFLLLFSVEFDF